MTTYNQRLARRTRNTFAPAKRFFQKAAADAPGIFTKAVTGGQRLFNKGLPAVTNTLSAIANNPITQAVVATNPELIPAYAGLTAANSMLQKAKPAQSDSNQLKFM
jgi:hypothetical protein